MLNNMAHGKVTINVPAELKSAATDGVVASAEGIFDYNKKKNQEVINQELYELSKNAIGEYYPE